MGLRATIIAAVNTAFNAVGDLIETGTYKSVTGSSYSPATGGVTLTSTDVPLSRTVFYDFEEKEIDGDVVVLHDMQMMLPTADLGAVVPKHEDVFTDSAGKTWEIQRRLTVPGNALTILHVRTTR